MFLQEMTFLVDNGFQPMKVDTIPILAFHDVAKDTAYLGQLTSYNHGSGSGMRSWQHSDYFYLLTKGILMAVSKKSLQIWFNYLKYWLHENIEATDQDSVPKARGSRQYPWTPYAGYTMITEDMRSIKLAKTLLPSICNGNLFQVH